MVRSVFEELKFLASQKKLEFTFECAEKAEPCSDSTIKESTIREIKIKADEQRMRQVIQNLIENSIKYTEKGYVKVNLKLTTNNLMANGYTLMTIFDSGMGIKPDVLPQLFDQFKRAKEAKLI